MRWILRQLVAEVGEPARAVLPLTAYLALFPVFAQWQAGVDDGSPFKEEMLFGIPVAVLGLAFFKLGLRLGLMPLGEQLGEKLPDRVGEIGVSVVSFLLAIVLTLAEPAIGALQQAATLLDRARAPLLATIFGNPQRILMLVLAIGIGVGVAATSGALRLLHDRSIKLMIVQALVPCLLATTIWSYLPRDMISVVGLAWDAGAVTTGPVTVPVVISLGIGLASSARRRRSAPSSVELAATGDYMRCDLPTDSALGAGSKHGEPAAALRETGEQSEMDDLQGFGIVTFASLWPVLGVLLLGLCFSRWPMPAAELAGAQSLAQDAPDAHTPGAAEVSLALQSLVPLVLALLFLQRFVLAEPVPTPGQVIVGVICVFLGLVMFNLGLNFGLLPLGNGAGECIASSYEALVRRGEMGRGMALVLCFAFVGSFAAQVAEPSLNVLGETVERVSHGAFPRRRLVYVVAFGVACGTAVGVVKVLWEVSMWKIVLPMYALALVLTRFASNGITCVAWDAGGVTTGSVTVPLILAIGLGLGKKREPPVADGFGLLGCASVFPIVTVLLAGIFADESRRRREVQCSMLLEAELGLEGLQG